MPVPSFFDFLPWKKKPIFKKSDLEAGIDRLKTFYRQQGFYHTEITTEVWEYAGHEVEVKIIIDEGPWIVTRSINVHEAGSPYTPMYRSCPMSGL